MYCDHTQLWCWIRSEVQETRQMLRPDISLYVKPAQGWVDGGVSLQVQMTWRMWYKKSSWCNRLKHFHMETYGDATYFIFHQKVCQVNSWCARVYWIGQLHCPMTSHCTPAKVETGSAFFAPSSVEVLCGWTNPCKCALLLDYCVTWTQFYWFYWNYCTVF